MTEIYKFIKGTKPLLLSMPHSGMLIPDDIKQNMTDEALRTRDTDWFQPEIYEFAKDMGASILIANYSRYVVDLNRSSDDINLYSGTFTTGLCPTQTFKAEEVYKPDYQITNTEKQNRISKYWQPYHDKIRSELDNIKSEFGHANLYDCHSIKSELPLLFDGVLPDLNIGTNKGKSCNQDIENKIKETLSNHQNFSSVINGRFIGGYITREYGDPNNNINSVQMELTWKNYMDEIEPYKLIPERVNSLRVVLKDILKDLL